ncbi:MAG: bacillithiol biosynthesis cysteine-adding enzyme BshC [Longimicrobiales bacterium]|jgi:bacillithiol biosynthesis cysteine-adding enzyme BshC
MELIVSRPSGAAVVRDYLDGRPEAVSFYRRHFAAPDAFREKAAEIDGRFDLETRRRAVEALIVPPGADAARLDAFVELGGYMVTTGQQPGLYGGPLYSIYKGLTAVRLAEALEERLGKPVIPVFWVASDDHDWNEANHTYLIGTDNELRRYELASHVGEVRPSLHRIELGPEADELLDDFVGALPPSDFAAEFVALLREGFHVGSTMPAGFHGLLQHLLGRFGLFFTDATHPGVKATSKELLLGELQRAEEFEGILAETATALRAAGYDLQVPILPEGVNLFLEGPAGRERLYRDPGGFRLRTSAEIRTESDVHGAFNADPASVSPNVLLRPVLESRVFPTLAYVGGPGEMAYFAQLGAYFEAHEIEMPIVWPRFAVTAIETKIGKVLEKFDVEPHTLQRPFHEVASDFARDEVPENVKKAIGQLRGAIGSGVSDLQKAATAVDPTLKGPVQTLRSQAFAALGEVEKKVTQAVKRESEIALAQIEKAQIHLMPNGKPAERVQSPLYYLARYGGAFLDDLYARFSVNLDDPARVGE